MRQMSRFLENSSQPKTFFILAQNAIKRPIFEVFQSGETADTGRTVLAATRPTKRQEEEEEK